MLKKLLNLLPVSIVRKLGDSSFATLQERGEIKTWMGGFNKNSSLLADEPLDKDSAIGDDADLIPGNFYYLGLQIRIVPCFRLADSEIQNYWDWFVYDGCQLLKNDESFSENESLEAAKNWVEQFVDNNEV